MAQYRVRLVGGDERTVIAQRVIHDHDAFIFESRGGQVWTVVDEYASTDVDVVQRRVVEFSGVARWITERPATLVG